jgi:predicted transcriptional regulator
MSHILRFPDLALGELEQEVLETLWQHGALNPGDVHQWVGVSRGISVNTVSSALKRLQEKGLLDREKVSHAYVYQAAVTRAELQRQLIAAIASKFAQGKRAGLLAAFVDVAEAEGEETLRTLEALIASRLAGGGK